MDFFHRINFFTGLFTTAKDWQTQQEYHVQKHCLHNSTVLTPGVVRGDIRHQDLNLKESLKVTVTGEGQIIVLPGYAIDGQGRDLYVPKPIELAGRSETKPPYFAGQDKKELKLYIAIGYGQETFDPRVNLLNNEYKGDAFVREHPVIEWSDTEPDNRDKLELARLSVKVGQAIRPEAVDTSHVPLARARFSGANAFRVQAGEAELPPNPMGAGLVFAADDEKVLIQAFAKQQDAENAIYVANVYPDLTQDPGDARIFWRIESSVTKPNQIAYYLLLKNFGSKQVKVRYSVYRLNTSVPL